MDADTTVDADAGVAEVVVVMCQAQKVSICIVMMSAYRRNSSKIELKDM